MSEELEELWGKLSLTEEEQVEVVVEKEWLEDSKVAVKNCLLGKLVLQKRVNVEAMTNVLSNVWKICSGLSVKEVGSRLYVFRFQDEMEKAKVLLKQPWSFNKSLLVLKNFEGHLRPSDVNLQWCPFWVQIHGLPLCLMTEKIGTILGESIGDVEEVDADEERMAWGCYLRVRVNINIGKPLKRGTKVAVEGKGHILEVFKYERLSHFYYICGRLDHHEIDCEEALKRKKAGCKVKREYGPWMSTESIDFLAKKVEGQKSEGTGDSVDMANRRTAITGGDIFGGRWSYGGGQWKQLPGEQAVKEGQNGKRKTVVIVSGENGNVSGDDRECLYGGFPKESNETKYMDNQKSHATVEKLVANLEKTDMLRKISDPELKGHALVDIPIAEKTDTFQATTRGTWKRMTSGVTKKLSLSYHGGPEDVKNRKKMMQRLVFQRRNFVKWDKHPRKRMNLIWRELAWTNPARHYESHKLELQRDGDPSCSSRDDQVGQ